ncbi:hypothetical protein GCM10009779_04520 [Polymorphospora rubra]|uniref:Uncharacterized protein n=1 Tax=Polymorphospora rubra TaxID=338584 RepID=A0A810MV59_9ACTN|nr:hypothetical protein Prubr_02190 [Polymorphospora rubra]
MGGLDTGDGGQQCADPPRRGLPGHPLDGRCRRPEGPDGFALVRLEQVMECRGLTTELVQLFLPERVRDGLAVG